MNGLVEHESGMEPCELSEELQEVAEQIRYVTRMTVVGVGKLLNEHLHKVPHGSKRWFLEVVCDVRYRTAYRATKVADAFANVSGSSNADIGTSALYLLADDRVPIEARVKAVTITESFESRIARLVFFF